MKLLGSIAQPHKKLHSKKLGSVLMKNYLYGSVYCSVYKVEYQQNTVGKHPCLLKNGNGNSTEKGCIASSVSLGN